MQISVSNLWEYVWWFYCLTTFPLPCFTQRTCFPHYFQGVFLPPRPCSITARSGAPVWPRIVRRGEGLGCWVWPTLIMGRTQPTDILNYSQSSTSVTFDIWSPNAGSRVLVTLSRHCLLTPVTTGQDTQERARACVTCGPGQQPGVVTITALSCELVAREGGRVHSELPHPHHVITDIVTISAATDIVTPGLRGSGHWGQCP